MGVEELPPKKRGDEPALKSVIYEISGAVALWTNDLEMKEQLSDLVPHTKLLLRGVLWVDGVDLKVVDLGKD